jgi:hypothetical protein
MPKTKKTSSHPKKGEPDNAAVTIAHTTTLTTAATAMSTTIAGYVSTFAGVERKSSRERATREKWQQYHQSRNE